MKKIFLFAATLLLTASAFAQQEKGTFTLQFKAGLNIADCINGGQSDPRIGLVVGAEGEYRLSKLCSLSLGALYSQQGDKGEGTINGYHATSTERLDYISFPLMINLYFYKGFALKAGLQPAVNINAAVVIKSGGDTAERTFKELGIDVNTFDLSLPLGLSYDIGRFVIDARYNIGLTDIIDNNDVHPRHSVFQFTLGYKFKL
jgi:hypothetical protein